MCLKADEEKGLTHCLLQGLIFAATTAWYTEPYAPRIARELRLTSSLIE